MTVEAPPRPPRSQPQDPEALIEEARRRTRLRRVRYAALVAAAALAGSAALLVFGTGTGPPTTKHGGHAIAHSARLTIITNNPRIGGGARAIFHLSCKPAGGDVLHPRAACASVGLILRRLPLGFRCPKPSGGPPIGTWATGNTTLFISGRLNGRGFGNVIRDPCRTRPTSDLISQILAIVDHDPSYKLYKPRVIKRY